MRYILAWRNKGFGSHYHIYDTPEDADAAFKRNCVSVINMRLNCFVCRFDTEVCEKYLKDNLEELMASATVTNRPVPVQHELCTPEWWKERQPFIQALVDGETILYDGEVTTYPSFLKPIGRYKIKPKTITVNGIEVEAPLPKRSQEGSTVYVAAPSNTNFYFSDNESRDILSAAFERGLVHATKEGAIAHAKAMLEVQK